MASLGNSLVIRILEVSLDFLNLFFAKDTEESSKEGSEVIKTELEIPGFDEIVETLNLRDHLKSKLLYEKVNTILGKILVKFENTDPKRRESWFKKNTLPERLRYVSISGSMPSPYNHLIETPEVDNAVKGVFLKNADDYRVQRSLQLEAFLEDWSRISDGTSNLDMTQFNPRRHMSLNPLQKSYKAEHLAILLADHIGIWVAATSGAEDQKSPFPRDALAKTLGAYLNTTRSK